ncbi:MAG TPA: putative sugar O-methyltransferase [Burkholderiales bacterium]|nr:putative sugar O-methyltransferase [Burkholderiales bacterium]
MIAKLLDSTLKPYGYRVVPSAILHDWQKELEPRGRFNASRLPPGAASYLRPDHPRLVELKRRYASFDRRVTSPLVWIEGSLSAQELRYFRGDNAYVWQLRGPNMDGGAYALATYYAKSIDAHGLLGKLVEDDYFGNFTFDICGTLVSRDLLDSLVEIYFLDRHLGVASAAAGLTVLDIGAGYGRLAHRMLSALPSVRRYLCTDAIAESTFLSEYYLGFRKLDDRARVLALNEIEAALEAQSVDLALNIHSFSECTPSAIDWWIALLARHRVKHLMIVPNAQEHGGELLLTLDRKDMRSIIERHGYRQVARDPKYRDRLVQKHAINPTCHFLFELAGR